MDDWDFFRRVLIVAAVVIFATLIWQLSQAFLLFFGAVLVGVLFGGASSFVERHTLLSRGQALILTIAAFIIVFGSIIALFGPQISAQIADLAQRLPGAVDNFEQRFGLGDLSGKLMEQVRSNSGSLLFQITSMAAFILSVAVNTVLVLVAGAYLAAQPELYRTGALKLVPPDQRRVMGETLDDAGAALKKWLIGQLLAMLVIGTLTGVIVWYIGLPAPVALGITAGIAEFVPILGPILGFLIPVLLAASMDPTTLLWTIGMLAVVQLLEAYALTPIIQRRMVSLPPVLTLFAILCFGLLFGPLGLLFATPMAVVTAVLVTRLYIRELLDEHAKVPGEKEAIQAAAERSAPSA
jgi:predicted PurR-regulated permease PerM